jgi:hypothetical protein
VGDVTLIVCGGVDNVASMNMIENEAERRVWILFKCGLKRVSYMNASVEAHPSRALSFSQTSAS